MARFWELVMPLALTLSLVLLTVNSQASTPGPGTVAQDDDPLEASSTFPSSAGPTETQHLADEYVTEFQHVASSQSMTQTSAIRISDTSSKYNETILYVTHTNASLFKPDTWPVFETDEDDKNKHVTGSVITAQSQTSTQIDATMTVITGQSASSTASPWKPPSVAMTTVAILANASYLLETSVTDLYIPLITATASSSIHHTEYRPPEPSVDFFKTDSADVVESEYMVVSTVLPTDSSYSLFKTSVIDSDSSSSLVLVDAESWSVPETSTVAWVMASSSDLMQDLQSEDLLPVETLVAMDTEWMSSTYIIGPESTSAVLSSSDEIDPTSSLTVAPTSLVPVAMPTSVPESLLLAPTSHVISVYSSLQPSESSVDSQSVVTMATTQLSSTPVMQTVAMATESSPLATDSASIFTSASVFPTSVQSADLSTISLSELTTPPGGNDSTSSVSFSPLTSALPSVSTEDSTFSAENDTTLEMSTDLLPLMTTGGPLVLNMSDAYNDHWVRTVISVKDSEADISSQEFWWVMEGRLAELYDEAQQRELDATEGDRKRRASQVNKATIQMTNVSRPVATEDKTDLVYILVEGEDPNGNLSTAERAVHLINTYMNEHEVVLILGYPVSVMAEPYLPPPGDEDKKLWIIGAVLGGAILLVLIIWLILFIYFKCTRPRKAYQGKSPPSPVPSDPEPELIDYKDKKDFKGFDYVRSEVGIESELVKEQQQQQQQESYRKRPYGSSELEGMYSPAESTPPKYPSGQQPLAKGAAPATASAPPSNRSSGRGYPPQGSGRGYSPHGSGRGYPPQGSGRGYPPPGRGRGMPYPARGRGYPRGAHPSQHRPAHRSGDGDSSSYESETSEATMRRDSTHLLHSSGGGQRSRSGSRGRELTPHSSTDVPPGEVRSSVHGIQMAGLVQQPQGVTEEARDTARKHDQEVQDTLKQKADIEKYRNKKRQRDKKKGKKHGKHQDIDNVLADPQKGDLPDVFVASPKKKRKKKKGQKSSRVGVYVDGDSPDSMEMKKLAQQQGIEPRYYGNEPPQPLLASERRELPHLETDSSDEEEVVAPPREQSLQHARQHMHNLLDDAFTLLTPQQPRRNKVGPISSYSYVNPSAILHRGHKKLSPPKRVNFDPSIRRYKVVPSYRYTGPRFWPVFSRASRQKRGTHTLPRPRPGRPRSLDSTGSRSHSDYSTVIDSVGQGHPEHSHSQLGEESCAESCPESVSEPNESVRQAPTAPEQAGHTGSQGNHPPVQEYPGPHHTPMYVQPPAKKSGDSLLWNPYATGDEVAKIPRPTEDGSYPPGTIVTPKPHKRSPYLNQISNGPVKPSSMPHQYSNSGFTVDPSDPTESRPMGFSTEQPEPYHKTTADIKKSLQPDDYTSIAMDSRMLIPESQRVDSSQDSAFQPSKTLPNGMPSSAIPNAGQSQPLSQTDPANGGPGYKPNGTAGYRGRTADGTDSDPDEIDIASRMGASAEPLVNSIREELQRLAQQANGHPSGAGVNGIASM